MIEFIELAKACAPDVHATTMMAIVRHESGFDPLAIGVNEKPHRSIKSKTRKEAIQAVQALLDSGKNFDAGYGQINSANWKWLGITPENVFDPCTNLGAAQRVLVNCYEGASKKLNGPDALLAALSCYNTGNYRNGLINGYVDKVLAGAKSTEHVKVPALSTGSKDHAHQLGAKSPQSKLQDAVPSKMNPDALGRNSKPDAFHAPRPDAFSQPFQAFSPVGSIIYHGRR
ncbi:type IV secretion system protein VirB1 [Pusillimonas sp. T7-7]|uniref:lytic transglycosylase domain-containing protein n=1 Tax=Pusillimonas sp. (strain T7-7) TaxID=1007105 RepID=UPI0002084C4C|nr:lytic transglycosylase domain-containing protein [Pusillimonas sp. T7-7]AEC18861.1 type IV secretion system protein VirB1 [Pusillimonas sp. T7-7]